MPSKVNYEELARAAAEGVARALSAKGSGGGSHGQAQEHALNLPPRLIFGGPNIAEQFQATFTERGGTVTVGQVTQAER